MTTPHYLAPCKPIPDGPLEHPLSVELAEPGEHAGLKAVSYIMSVLGGFPIAERRRILAYVTDAMLQQEGTDAR